MSKTLVIYYSQARGNTERIAKLAAEAKDADLVRIDTVTPYTGSYNAIVDQGQREVNKGFKPAIKPVDIDWDAYDTVVLGTPTWWYTMAPAVLTFLTEYGTQLKGKTVVPFQTHGGWPGHTLDDMEALCKGAKVVNRYAVNFDDQGGDRLETPMDEINEWLASL